MEQDLNTQVSMESVAKHIGELELTILYLKEGMVKAEKAIEALQQQLLKYQKNEKSD